MAKTTHADTVIIVDDEPHNMMWMIDYIEGMGLKVKNATNANDAMQLFSEGIYRAAIIDLNIPIFTPAIEAAKSKSIIYGKYPGLYVAHYARNIGYRGKQIVIYSVHKDNSVSEEVNKLSCTYIIKGRPKEIKAEMEDILKYDPTA